ncbi:MAG: ATP-binding protein [Deltaproteobacteria bacterium]|nr:ATP-binding protein [Deltaproteobacteria bacterium]
MVFIAGPRQAGKTVFTKMLAKKVPNSLYFNWDILDEKRKLIENPSFYEEVHRKDSSLPLIIFDELHKYSAWKNYLKSVYDRDKGNYKFIVSGSGRLDMYQKRGDSLAGRYLMFYLWPFTLAELAAGRIAFEKFMSNPIEIHPAPGAAQTIWQRLEQCTGFPDPYLDGTVEFYRIWSNTYRKQLLREDIRDLTSVRNIEDMEILFSLLPSRVGSPLSMAALSRDIGVSFDSVRKWIDLFEGFFMVFRIAPWARKISRAITKEKKLYLFDYAGVDSPSGRFENMVALELFRAVSNWNDLGLGHFSLHYLRNKEKEEVDFLIAGNHKPLLLIETKLADDDADRGLRKFQKTLHVPGLQLVNRPGICKLVSNNNSKILIISADHWLASLP